MIEFNFKHLWELRMVKNIDILYNEQIDGSRKYLLIEVPL